ncbi:IclR family transcriptional regulator [Streptomyces sp. NPDC051963]|uniref:IclR family transcriptional regulator n=1 Tax=Streptomyces sp. NPDC051963 TaxID=3365678 RepID=UPI0037D7C324
MPSADTGGRSVLEGAFGLLAAVEHAQVAGLTRLAADCGLPKTTAYRLLEQLVDLGAVERIDGGYRVGPRMFSLGQRWEPHPGLRPAAREPARRLAQVTGAMVGVSALWEGQTLVVDWAPSAPDDTRDRLRDEVTWPWNTAAGKVLVAGAHPRLPLGPLPATWQREAEAIRDRGVAFDREELVAGVCCVAVPLTASGGSPVAALCVVTDPAHRLDRLADVVQRAGRTISARLRGGAL